ncbi:MAG: hypothetical protein Q7Q71_04585 [Verrucomicrobiota bacterium JB023]|nr:hypothetical protein [Verrucomicrobiota bacterium JB023]
MKLLLLTPLVLGSWTEQEIAVFYIVLSVVAFTNLITEFLPGILNPVLVFFYSGVENLENIGKENHASNEPNWKGFGDTLHTLRASQWILMILFVAVSTAILLKSLVNQIGWEPFKNHYYEVPIIIALQIILQVSAAGYSGALRAVNEVAAVNKNGAIFALLQILGSALAVYCGGTLTNILWIQLMVALVGRLALFRLYRSVLPDFPEVQFSKEILSFVLKPALKRLVGVLSVTGVRLLSPALLAGILLSPQLILYSLMLAILNTLISASNAFVLSQLPRLGSLYARGEVGRLRSLVFRRVCYSVSMFLVLAIPCVLSGWFYTNHFDSKLAPLSMVAGILAVFLFLALFLINILSACYNVTNERPFYLRNLFSGLITLGLLYSLAQASFGGIVPVLLIVIAPQVLLVFPLLIQKMKMFLSLSDQYSFKNYIKVESARLLEELRGYPKKGKKLYS